MKTLLKAFLCALILAVSVHWILDAGGSTDALFFGAMLLLAPMIASLASPNWNVLLGARRLWLFDWIPIVLMPIFVLRAIPSTPIEMACAYYLGSLVYLLSGTIVARKFMAGRR